MHNVMIMHPLECLAKLDDPPSGIFRLDFILCVKNLPKCTTRTIFHDHEETIPILEVMVESDNVGVGELGKEIHLSDEELFSLGFINLQRFECHIVLFQKDVLCEIDIAESSATKHSDKKVLLV